MTKKEAEILVQNYLAKNLKGFSIIPESTMESESCFAIFYQSDEYLKSKKIEDMAIGQGPTIVSKIDGKLFQTGSGRFVEDSINSFEKYGDPYLEKDNSRIILSLDKNASIESSSMISILKKITGKGILESKQILTDLTNGGTIDFENELTENEFEQLNKLGFIIDYPWLN
ncbi:hypothetical protein [Winogradskyella sp. SYSU M77433]|uniref:hypothetical protein n=1 Tax=Winogradskyella sp. SYSU M77433 TaxID=3042722 RepID=UPI00247FB8BC|nr:hypothetical protein [Winogradskyella sp. SYSU M77433]MDH7914251.1 hypothetical protein [Winogradskyella sp. SYSU M77433]